MAARTLQRLANRGLVWAPLLALVVLLAAPALSTATLLKGTLWLSFGIVALSLALVWGVVGIFSFGQNAFFGIGGYVFAVAAVNIFPGTGETLTAMALGAGAAAIFAAILGYVTFYGRVGDVYLAIVTLSVTLILYTVMSSTAGPEYHIGQAQLGGFNGMPSVPGVALGSGELGNRQTFAFAVCLAAALYVLVRFLASGRYGRILAGLRENELRMELLGYDVRLHKLIAFVIGGAVAGTGGTLFAAWGTFINPAVFSLPQAALVAIWVMVGGRTSLAGAFVGVAVVQWICDQADKVVAQQTPLILGVMLVATVMAFPSGIVPSVSRLISRRRRSAPAEAYSHTTRSDGAPQAAARGRLVAQHLGKRFGGSIVLEDVSLSFGETGIDAVIGPNGAGKSTLFGLLTGRHAATQGRIELNGRDITRLPVFRRARAGLGIKLQVPGIFLGLTVRENIALAAMAPRAHGGAGYASAILGATSLSAKMDTPASALSHGEQQWLEIAMVVAQNPSVMLLDEPAAGMTRDERHHTVELIRSLSTQRTVVVVEHDMDFIRALGAPVAMLHRGVVFRQGEFAALSNDPEVRDAYLGRRRHAGN
ncbi:MAG TPA: ATP-binding cassette domain-containing protein [Burkholderiales bacterium]|nr:ATP-binding cassette domain-containing protein [Burkholderiales bacterium]